MAASTLDMDMAVSRATSLHRRQLHSHTYSCFLELVIQVFSLLLHRATLIRPRSCQTRSHTQEGHTSFLQTWSIGITTTYSDNLLTHNTTRLDSQPTRGSSAATFISHQSSHCVQRPHTFFSHQTYQCHHLWEPGAKNMPPRGSCHSQRDYPCPQPSNDHTLSRHMTSTIHTPPTTKPLSQPTSDVVLAPDYLPTETPHSH